MPTLFLRTVFSKFFGRRCLVEGLVRVPAVLVQHTLCHPPKMWALQVSKNGRTVKSIYSHNIFRIFATKKWHFYRKYGNNCMIKWGGHIYGKKITVNMPTLKSSLTEPSKSMLFFHIWNANFSVTPINSQMYMTKPKQVQKNSQKILGKLFP